MAFVPRYRVHATYSLRFLLLTKSGDDQFYCYSTACPELQTEEARVVLTGTRDPRSRGKAGKG